MKMSDVLNIKKRALKEHALYWYKTYSYSFYELSEVKKKYIVFYRYLLITAGVR